MSSTGAPAESSSTDSETRTADSTVDPMQLRAVAAPALRAGALDIDHPMLYPTHRGRSHRCPYCGRRYQNRLVKFTDACADCLADIHPRGEAGER